MRDAEDRLLEAGLADLELGGAFLHEHAALEQEGARLVRADRNVGREPHGGAEQVLRQELHAADILAVEAGRRFALAQRGGEFLDGRRAVGLVGGLHVEVLRAERELLVLVRVGDVLQRPRRGDRIGHRHVLERLRFQVDPDAEHPVLAAHDHRPRRPLEHDDDVVAPLTRDQRIGVFQRSEDGEVGAREAGGDRDGVRRQPDLDAFGRWWRLRRRRRQGKQQRKRNGGCERSQPGHQLRPAAESE